MSKFDYQNLISKEIKQFIEKKIETRKLYKELIQIKKNIVYLKQKYGKDESEEFDFEKGKLVLKKYKTKFSSKLKKEFNELTDEEKRELYKSGLLTIYFRLNYRKFEKLKKDENQKTPVDEYAIERKQIQPFYWNLLLNPKIKNELKEFEQYIKDNYDLETLETIEKVEEELDEIEKDRNLMADSIAQQIDAERELVIELLEEIELDPVHFTDDNPDDVQYTNTPENREKGIIRDNYEDDDIPF